MKTLIIVSHPDIAGSASQQYLKESVPTSDRVTFHHLDACYPDGEINRQKEQELLREHDRIIFQFPLYWYSSPALLKQWQDDVLTDNFAYGVKGNELHGKQFGLVIVIGNSEKEYQAGGREHFALSAITIPFQAMAGKVGMTYLKPFLIYQFQYMTEAEKMRVLITYQQYLTMNQFDSLRVKEQWIIKEIKKTSKTTLPANSEFILDQAIDQIEHYRTELDEIQRYFEGE